MNKAEFACTHVTSRAKAVTRCNHLNSNLVRRSQSVIIPCNAAWALHICSGVCAGLGIAQRCLHSEARPAQRCLHSGARPHPSCCLHSEAPNLWPSEAFSRQRQGQRQLGQGQGRQRQLGQGQRQACPQEQEFGLPTTKTTHTKTTSRAAADTPLWPR